MKSFEEWFNQEYQQKIEPVLPDGVWERNGVFFAYCRSCGNEYEIYHDPIADGFDQDFSYCGSSPLCLP